ncbi:MAG: GNAT family N-acetyltransferase [Thermomicrobiales bacterium]
MITRDVRYDDAPILQQHMRDTPQGTDGIEFSFVNEPDFFARAHAYESSRTLVAEEAGQLAGSASFAVRELLVAGQLRRVAYEFQYFTAPMFRRAGVARKLRARIDEELLAASADLSSAIILRENEASIGLFSQFGFRQRASLVVNFMIVEHTDMRLDNGVSPARRGELDEIAELINETWAGHDFYAAMTAASLRQALERIPTVGLDRLFVKREQGRIVACAAIWDWTYVQKVLVHHIAPEAASVFPTLRPNTVVQQWGVTMVGYRSSRALRSLLLHISNLACHCRIDHVALPFETDSELAEATSKIASAQIQGDLYLRPLTDLPAHGQRPIYLDIIDF